MSLPRRDDSRLLAAAVVLVLFGLACSGPDRTQGVAVRNLGTDVGLGVEPTDAGPANVVVRRARRPSAPDPRAPEKFTIDAPGTTPLPVRARCPAAGTFDFPKEEAGIAPKGIPAEGVLSWKYEGSVDTEQGTVQVDQILPRLVGNVVFDPAIDGAFRYSITDFTLYDDRANSGGRLETTYLVVPDSPAESDASSRDEGRGMYLASIVFRSMEGGEQTEQRFEWTPPVLMFPFPAVPGTQIDSTGVNAADGSRLTITGRIERKAQLDACGDRIDSWLVDGDMLFEVTDPETLQRESFESDYDYNIAPQFGSLLVGEHVKAPPGDDPVIDIDARVGEVPERGEPAPEPDQ